MGRIFTSFLFLTFVCSILSCTGTVNRPGQGGSTPQVDANGIQGLTEKAYYHVINLNEAKVVLTKGKGEAGRLLAISSRKITSEESISAENISFSVDESILVVKGREEIFEKSAVSIDSILNSESPLTPAKVDSYCKGLSGAYPEIVVEATSTYQLYGVSAIAKDVIGGTEQVDRIESQTTLEYRKPSFGSLVIDKTRPHPTDSDFFKAEFSAGTPIPWNRETNFYCRSNSIPITVELGNVLVAETAFDSATMEMGLGDFDNHQSARTRDSIFANWTGTSANSDYLVLTGFFSRPEQLLPQNAVIDGLNVSCFWYLSDSNLEAEMSIRKAVGPVGTARQVVDSMLAAHMGPSFGGPNDLWTTSFSPQDINSPSFGFQIRFSSSINDINVGIDYCRVSVYWH